MKIYSILLLIVLEPLVSGFTSSLMVVRGGRELQMGPLASMSRKASATRTNTKSESAEIIDEINDNEVEFKFDPLRPFKNFSREIKKPFIEGPIFGEMQNFYILFVAAALSINFEDHGFTLSSAKFPIYLVLIHSFSSLIAVEILLYKGFGDDKIERRKATIRALAAGPSEIFRISLMQCADEREARLPLEIEVSTQSEALDNREERRRRRLYGTAYEGGFINVEGQDTVLQTLTIKCIEGNEIKVRKLLNKLAIDSKQREKENFLYLAARQDANNKSTFALVQRYADVEDMRRYQGSATVKLWGEKMRPLLDGPMDVYVTNEKSSDDSDS